MYAEQQALLNPVFLHALQKSEHSSALLTPTKAQHNTTAKSSRFIPISFQFKFQKPKTPD
jgi:hypothetical protein